MRQCEFKRKYHQEIGKYKKQHIYGEGILDSISNFLFNAATKKAAKGVSKKAATAALNKTGHYLGKKSGEKIVQLLQKQSSNKNQTPDPIDQYSISKNPDSQLSDDEINERVQRLLGSGIRKLKI